MPRRARLAALLALALSGLAVGAGCGEGDGVAAGATVNVYVAAPLCAEARGAVRRAGGEAGDVRVRVVCLAQDEGGDRVDLVAAGANARRASEDSTTVAFLEADGPAARFAQTIVEGAGVAWVETDSGATATDQVLEAIEESGSGSLRDQVRRNLEAE
ncbi:MAG: hypothetical protein ACOYD4_13575 [Solirubrobacterales bacterium]